MEEIHIYMEEIYMEPTMHEPAWEVFVPGLLQTAGALYGPIRALYTYEYNDPKHRKNGD